MDPRIILGEKILVTAITMCKAIFPKHGCIKEYGG
jgi:hypothetical protein